MTQCARCPVYVCRAGDREHGPEACPMHGDFPAAEYLYVDAAERSIARVAALVEASGYRRWKRTQEVMEFAKRLDFRRLGVVFCSDMASIAEIYIRMLNKNGFETVSAGNPGRECEPETLASEELVTCVLRSMFSLEKLDYDVFMVPARGIP